MRDTTSQPATPRLPRIAALDGLRGLAILFVFINHLRLEPLINATPGWLAPLWLFISANGKAGVTLFFILSGYWAVTLYRQVPDPWKFLQKRYARIFPALLVMCVSLSFIRLFWTQLPLVSIPIIVVGVTLAYATLRHFWNRLPIRNTSLLFSSFVGLQMLVAGYYLFVLPLTPPAIFYQVWPDWLRQVVTFFVNATMTLPLGPYIAQLDGVYWALTVELTFYVLYPWLLLPFFKSIVQQKSLWIKILAVVLTFPLIAGLYLILEQFLGFYIYTFYLFIFIIAGMVLAELNHTVPEILQKVTPPNWFHPWAVIGGGILILFSRVWLYRFLPATSHWLLDMAWVGPVIVGMCWVLYAPALRQWLSQPWLVKLGTYSFAIYLTHTIAIEMFMKGGEPKSVGQALLKIGGAIVITGLLSVALYRWVEQKPSAVAKKPQSLVTKSTLQVPESLLKLGHLLGARALTWTWLLMCVTIMGMAWYGSRAPLSILQPIHSHSVLNQPNRLVVTGEPQDLTFTASQAHLGMILLHLKQIKTGEAIPSDSTPMATRLLATVINQHDQVVSTAEFQIMELGDSRFHPIGIPVQADSSQQTYKLRLQALNPQPDQTAVVINDGVTLHTVYFPSKATLLRHPLLLAATLWSQFSDPFVSSHTAQLGISMITPFMALMAWLISRKNSPLV